MAGTAAASVASITATVDEAAFRPVHAWLFLAAVGGTLMDGVSVFMTGLAVPLLRAQFAMGPLEVGLLGSALVLGAVFGAMLGGHLADRLGRKDVFLADMALLAVAALILVLADFDRLGAGRPAPGRRRHRHGFPGGLRLRRRDHAGRRAAEDGRRHDHLPGCRHGAGVPARSLAAAAVGLRRSLALAVRLAGGPRDRFLRPAPLRPREPALAGSARASGRRHPGGAPLNARGFARRRAPRAGEPAPRHQKATAPCSAPPSCGSPSSPPAPGSSWTSRPTASASSRP